MLYCFLDTNILLQYKTFDEIDWLKVLETTEVCLVIPMKVIQELDKFKYDSANDRRKSRANTILRKIEGYQQREDKLVRERTTIRVTVDSPTASWLDTNGYDPDDADDRIVGAIQLFGEQNTNTSLILFSGDFGIRLKAQAKGINCKVPHEELKLPEEPNPLEQKNRRLQQELQRLQNAQPKLGIVFEGEAGSYSSKVDFYVNFADIILLEEEIEQKIQEKFELEKYKDEIASANRSRSDLKDEFSSMIAAQIPSLGEVYPSKNEVNTYHEKLNNYVQNEYRNYLLRLNDYEYFDQLTCTVKLVIENTGTLPAKNVDIWLYLPDRFQILDKQLLPPFEPHPPQKPRVRNYLDSFAVGSITSPSLYIPHVSSANNHKASSGPTISIRKTNSYEIEWGPVDLKHNQVYLLPELYLYFDPIEVASTGFEIDYEITADNLVNKVEGKLAIVLHRVENSPKQNS